MTKVEIPQEVLAAISRVVRVALNQEKKSIGLISFDRDREPEGVLISLRFDKEMPDAIRQKGRLLIAEIRKLDEGKAKPRWRRSRE
jgi:hypothetical protein